MRNCFFVIIMFFNLVVCSQTVNNALYLDQSKESYVQVENVSQMNVTNNFTLEAWIKPQRTENWAMIIQEGDCTPSVRSSYHLSMQPDSFIYFTFTCGGNCDYYNTYICTTKVLPGLCTHISVTYSPSGVRIFYNGIKQPGYYSHGSYCGSIYASQGEFRIAAYRYFDQHMGAFFDGMIDDVRLWNRVLSDQEIFDYNDLELSGTEAGLVFYMDFNTSFQGNGQVIQNMASITGSAADGTTYSNSINNPHSSGSCFQYAGIGDLCTNKLNFKVYPNPAKNGLNIENADDNCAYDIVIKDVMGRIIFKEDNVESHYFLNTDELNSGIYMYSIYCKEKGFVSGLFEVN